MSDYEMPLLTPATGLAIKRSKPIKRSAQARNEVNEGAKLSTLFRKARQTARIDLPSDQQQLSRRLRVYDASAHLPVAARPAAEIVCVQPQQLRQLLDAIGDLSLAQQAVQQSLLEYDRQTGAQRMSIMLRLHEVTQRLQQTSSALNAAPLRNEF